MLRQYKTKNRGERMKIHHVCIQTNCYKESLKFYQDILNFKLEIETTNFSNRAYNSWLDLNGFMIELQTGKDSIQLNKVNINSEGLVHFCLYSESFDKDYKKILNNKLSVFKEKNGNKIYNIENNRLFKLIAPEGTIIEVRDSETP